MMIMTRMIMIERFFRFSITQLPQFVTSHDRLLSCLITTLMIRMTELVESVCR